MNADAPPATDFAVYLHWPFCQSKCPYCDFNSHVAASVDQGEWAGAFEREIERLARETAGRTISSVYFGGGTPSLMDARTVDRIMRALRKSWPMRNSVEVTLEANPSSVEAARFRGYRDAGVNRVSMGFQALNDGDLRKLGRLHDTKTALQALEVARGQFDRVSFDLIYARQDQTLEDWGQELRRALGLGPTHLSLYQLTIEDGTAFAQRHSSGGLHGLPNEDLAADMYLLTQQICEDAGLPAYEVSNHAAPGQESYHNLTYWRGGDYLGIGPGAHGRLTLNGRRYATVSPNSPSAWLESVLSHSNGESPRTLMSQQDWAEETLLMGLRMTEGLDLRRLEAVRGKAFDWTTLGNLVQLGMLSLQGDRAIATRTGRLVLNAVIREIAIAAL